MYRVAERCDLSVPIVANKYMRVPEAQVLSPTGKRFTDDNIGDIVATRDLLDNLRGFGEITSGPPPLSKRARSNFLQRLDEVVQEVCRRQS